MTTKQARHDAAALPRIHALKADGRSLREIADLLQQDGVPPPAEPRSAQAEPPPAPAPQLQKSEEQVGNVVDQRSARIQEREEQLGNAGDHMSARVQDKIGTAES